MRQPDRSIDSLAKVLPFLKILTTALHSLPDRFHFSGTLWRGERSAHPQFSSTFAPGSVFSFYSFTSFSPSPAALRTFCGGSGPRTLTKLVGARGYAISMFSKFGVENEVLLEPVARLECLQAVRLDPFVDALAEAGVGGTPHGLHLVECKHSGTIPLAQKVGGSTEAQKTSAEAITALGVQELSARACIETGFTMGLDTLNIISQELSARAGVETGFAMGLDTLNIISQELSARAGVETGFTKGLDTLNIISQEFSGRLFIETGFATGLEHLRVTFQSTSPAGVLTLNSVEELQMHPLQSIHTLTLRLDCNNVGDDGARALTAQGCPLTPYPRTLAEQQ
eukprot:NODE_951_length_1747_cov_22.824074_g891_i0.p1 GENE.NODE_951_length_1747_cov_22.824074_g891_i0~~NODE_951_length_1747_cov_22.824074_g891_i0.p1  ORF type:complete len:394 (+),score=87.84 NODE_951_length_1747_cov_22.824074_g891_i0:164-1183(+)